MSLIPQTIVPPQYQRLYETNTTFRVSVDTIAALLPLWLDGLADHAQAVGEWNDEQVRIAMSTNGHKVPMLPDDLRRGAYDPLLGPEGPT